MKKQSKRITTSQTPDRPFSRNQVIVGIILTIFTCLIASIVTVNKIYTYKAEHPEFEITSEGPAITVENTPSSSVLALKQEANNSSEMGHSNSEVKYIEVQNGDNFWKISKRACGKGNYYLEIQSDNGYTNRALKSGDIITVDCSKY